jgi:hypothetical protein
MTSGTCDAVMQLNMTEHDFCIECNPPTKPEDEWFAPLHCDSCRDAKTRLFTYVPLKVDESERMVSICTQFVTHHVSGDGTKTELERTPFTRVCAALPKYLERYIGYVVLPEYFKTRIVRMSPVDGELDEFVTVTAYVLDVCLF